MSELMPFQPAVENFGSRSLTAADVRAQVNLMQDVMREVMLKDTHYGVIPGTKTPSLYKPGAEKIMSTFRLAADPEVESLGTNGEIHYRVKVSIKSASGLFLGAGIGECSSSEEKYAWRAAVCDEEYDATPENRRRVKWSKWQGRAEQKRQVRTNPADVANTILKMAKKRALVDGILTVTAASDLFTQDIEDLPPEVVAEIVGDRGRSDHTQAQPRQQAQPTQERLPYSPEAFANNLPTWTSLILDGKKSAAEIIMKLESKAIVSEEQKTKLRAIKKQEPANTQGQQAESEEPTNTESEN